jgi:hypothetical protein
MKHHVIAAIFALTATPTLSCDALSLHVGSYHTDRDLITDVNEINPGIGCRFDDVALGLSVEAGAYKNSYSDVTPYAMVIGSPDGLSWFAGIAGGYQDDVSVPDHGVTGIAGIQYATDNMTLRASPSYSAADGDYGLVLGLSINIGAKQ